MKNRFVLDDVVFQAEATMEVRQEIYRKFVDAYRLVDSSVDGVMESMIHEAKHLLGC